MSEILAKEIDADEAGFVSRFVSAPDGLRLHAVATVDEALRAVF